MMFSGFMLTLDIFDLVRQLVLFLKDRSGHSTRSDGKLGSVAGI